MTSRRRSGVSVVIIALAVIMAAVFGVSAAGTTAQVAETTDEVTWTKLLPAAAGAWLKVIGIVGLYVSQAIAFRDWSTFALPFAPALDPLGRRGRRRSRRQIDGEEPYESSEVRELRSIAQHRVSLVAAGSGRATRFGSLSLLLFFAGFLLQPLGAPDGTDPGHVLARSFQVLAVIMVTVLLASLAFPGRRAGEKAETFLLRTSAGEPRRGAEPHDHA